MVLVWLMAIPLIGSFIVLFSGNRLAKGLSVIVSFIELMAFLILLIHGPMAFNRSWIPSWGVRFHLGADGLSMFLIGLTAILTLMAILASSASFGRAYFFWLIFLEFGTIGLFESLDLVLFYVFWEVILVPIFFLLTGYSGPQGRGAAMKWLIMNLVGSLFMLIGIVAVAVIHAAPFGSLTFEINQLSNLTMNPAVAPWVFASFFIAFAIKAPLWPFHGWMPDSYREAPPPVTALLSGVMSKAGIYGFLRIMLPIFMPQMQHYQVGLLIFAVIGLVYGGFMALRQTDMKMISAYSSLSHMGMMALGVFSLTTAGILGATFLMVAHGLIVGGLFIVLGFVEERTKTRDIKVLGGLNEDAPRLGAYFLFFALAALGLPGLPGFVGEYLIIQGLVGHDLVFAIIAGIVLVVAAWYMIRLFQGVMQAQHRAGPITDMTAGQVSYIASLALLIVLLGVWPAGITAHAAPTLYHAVHLIATKGGQGL
ncbi:complex I subunit 4 family protein [Sulfobacillus thermosulfidooxidans]|uniref:complex I subunit 4 family protein n=1 Tax=Sulfobacillus thermosulfidooxidans TaxID=28034 RepID=UPI0002D8C795|nr:NADH-quinone oxidoreductase subunit M [Sulfobacillus thermosulfidooxidans]OLZ08678.1 NADH dehydrogenase [Sulfobacillus thermosulfidooxidans]OLZ17301.1 NADH dehydrogenase [Sulfobacillus thermosulfidooxidans]OLZ19382.1 NADH dehydrogenase [Sulfobacillus thermosulfidooxidans]